MTATTAVRPITALVAVTYLSMVAVNIAANTLPINGIRTGDVSDAYPNLFAPAGYAFSIWSVIYLLLGLHVLYQFGLFRGGPSTSDRAALLDKVGVYFSISSLANVAWVFAWHYDAIALSVVLIVVILVCLALITRMVVAAGLTRREKLFVGVPFSVYFGWITVATVANVTVFLVSVGWDGFGLAESTWTVVVLFAAAAIGTMTMLRNRDVAYGVVLLWAYTGILVKHLSADGFDGGYPRVVTTVIACLAIFLAAVAVLLFRRRSEPSVS
ncbi:tryptophan-rich sensory protein [Mycobacterium sp. B14F4]|uniref:tryptophan-rich sensory protein n=1 Tax=Mycobacterium sp. B14F4 TaxID=3153565 RepID=UPI00325CEEA0